MYLRATQRRNKDGSVVRYYAPAENVRHPGKGYATAPAGCTSAASAACYAWN